MLTGAQVRRYLTPSTECFQWARRLAREEGMLIGELDRTCRTYQAFIARYPDNGLAVTATRNLEDCRRRLLEASEPILNHQTYYRPRRNHP